MGELGVAGARGAPAVRRAAEQRPRDVFVYFDNDAKVHTPADAISLARKLA